MLPGPRDIKPAQHDVRRCSNSVIEVGLNCGAEGEGEGRREEEEEEEEEEEKKKAQKKEPLRRDFVPSTREHFDASRVLYH